jgi:hypothetical protein
MIKRFITFLTIASSSIVLAGEPDSLPIVVTAAGIGTNTTVSTQGLSGRVVGVDITVSGGVAFTNAISLYSGNINILNVAALSGAGFYMPRQITCGTNGVALNVATNSYETAILVQDRVTLKAINLVAASTNTITARIMLEK